MPKLLVQKKRKGGSAPPKTAYTSTKTYTVPSSPFQKLIHGAMEARALSGRELARKLTAAKAPVSQSTIWIWLHHPNGHPHPRSFKPAHAVALAKVLGLRLPDIHNALDASRHIYTAKESPMPAETHDALATLHAMIASGKAAYVKRARVLHLIELIQKGAAQ